MPPTPVVIAPARPTPIEDASGATLMEIDARRQQAAVSSQQAELAAAEAAVGYARR